MQATRRKQRSLVFAATALVAVGISLAVGTLVRISRESDTLWVVAFTSWQLLGYAHLSQYCLRDIPEYVHRLIAREPSVVACIWTNDWGLVDARFDNGRVERLGVRNEIFLQSAAGPVRWMSNWRGLETFLTSGLIYGVYGTFFSEVCDAATSIVVVIVAAIIAVAMVYMERWAAKRWSPHLGPRWQMIVAVSPVLWPVWWFTSNPVRDAAVLGGCLGFLTASCLTRSESAPLRRSVDGMKPSAEAV